MSQITSLTVVYSTVYSDADQIKHQSSASLAFVWGIHRDRWIPRTKGQLRGKCFHLMTSSWYDQTYIKQSIHWEPGTFKCLNIYRHNDNHEPLCYHGLTFLSSWIRDHIPCKVLSEIAYPFPNGLHRWSLGTDEWSKPTHRYIYIYIYIMIYIYNECNHLPACVKIKVNLH